MLDTPFTFDRVIRIGIVIAIVWGIVSVIAYLSDVLIPFAIAALLAYLMNPLVVWIQRRLPVSSRLAAVLLSLLSILAGCVLLGVIFVPLIIGEITHMKELITKVVKQDVFRAQAITYLPTQVWQYLKDLMATEEVLRLLTFDNVRAVAQQVLPGVWSVFSGTVSFLIGLLGLVIILLYLIFILLDYEEVSKGWKNLIPQQYKQTTVDVLDDFTQAMSRYFRAQALIAFIVGVLHAFGFWLIGLPMGIILGLFIGLLNMVPYLQVIGLIPAVLFAFMASLETGQSVWEMLALVMLVFAVVQLIQDALLVPKIMGHVTGFNSAMILLSLSVWGKLLGILGLIIALPLTFLLYSYYKRFLSLSVTRSAPEE